MAEQNSNTRWAENQNNPNILYIEDLQSVNKYESWVERR